MFDWPWWNTPWELYFKGFIWLPAVQRLLLLAGPGLKAMHRHGRHLGWGWERLLELPRGRSIAINLAIGLIVPLLVGLGVRLAVGPFGGDWNDTKLWVSATLVVFLVIHSIFDLRRILKTRQVIVKIVKTDIDRYRSYYDRLRRWGQSLVTSARGDGKKEPGFLRSLASRYTGQIVERATEVLDQAMATPHKMARRWNITSILEGFAFHLSPVMALAILLFI